MKTETLQLRVHLEYIEPQIWRRMIVPASLTLPELHAAIQGAMGWQDYHMHSFQVDGQWYETPEDDEPPVAWGNAPVPRDERKFKVGDLVGVGDKFKYTYDFGDNWNHIIVVEKPTEKAGKQPVSCVAGERSCPPEDCGGSSGYENLLEVLADPEHEDHEDLAEWAPDGFDAEAFNLRRANAQIRAQCIMYRERGEGFKWLK